MESFNFIIIIILGIYIFKKNNKGYKKKMQTESIELSFLSIFAFITFFYFLIINKFSYKIKNGALLDNDFLKPQAFHDEPISRSGGIASIISLILFFIIYYLYIQKFYMNIFYLSQVCF